MNDLLEQLDGIDDILDHMNEREEDVHIWLKQRSSRKYVTEVQNLAKDLNLNKIVKCWRHEFHCAVAKIKTKDKGKILRLQGDQRQLVLNFLVQEKIIAKEKIKVHGF